MIGGKRWHAGNSIVTQIYYAHLLTPPLKVVLQPGVAEKGTENDKHAILTIQPRIVGGSLAFAEITAGMLDGETFSGGAAKEIGEETGLKVKESELVDMTALPSRSLRMRTGKSCRKLCTQVQADATSTSHYSCTRSESHEHRWRSSVVS